MYKNGKAIIILADIKIKKQNISSIQKPISIRNIEYSYI